MSSRGVRAFLVDRIKRRALEELHRTATGETAVLEGYLSAERLPEAEALFRELAGAGPEWLREQLAVHATDEARHARLLEERLAALRGASAGAGAGGTEAGFVAVSPGKLRMLRALVDRWAAEFAGGRAVALLGVALALERMGVRVMSRHLDVLRAAEIREHRKQPTAATLESILRDEKRHVRDCERALDRLIQPGERLALARLLDEADRITAAFGVTGAMGMLVLGVALRGVEAVRGAARTAEARL
jgi:hypothetical protein